MDAPVAGGLGQPEHLQLVQQGADLVGRLADHGERDTGCRVEVDAQLVGVLGIGRLHGPDVEAEAAQVHRPQHVGHVGGHQGP